MTSDPGNLVPHPDPTILTTEALHREIKLLGETVDRRFGAADEKLETEVRHAAEISALKDEITKQKFTTVEVRFEERDKQAGLLAIANQRAIDAALQSHKDAAAKAETNFSKLIDGLTARIEDLKERQTRGEGRGGGLHSAWGYLVAVVMAGIAVIALFISGFGK